MKQDFINSKELTDSELYKLCQEYGLNARQWMRKFAGLLPEVYRRRLYRRHGCSSINEFAAKIAGMSTINVDRILRLSRKLEDKPTLRSQLENGEQGWSKIEAVAFVATPKNEKEWALKVEKLPLSAISECVKNERKVIGADNFQPEKWSNLSFPVDPATELGLRQIKKKFEKIAGETMSWNEIMKKLIKERKQKQVSTKKQITIMLCPDCIKERARKKAKNDQVGRATPTEIQRLIQTRQQSKCDTPNCNHPIEEFHHTQRFALNQSHNPDFMVGLCKKCHNLEHSNWQMFEVSAIDQKVLNYRREISQKSRAGP
ncbi:hypothetical protein HN748_01920 [Candidatus Peregrinibacteria bacterium]|jgi:hypothetical protein|nr:hypothetical protein [Candidatus Peregrinibacteria bacterium]MBT7702966.1 hypothetical protein [Candidatus Peregrinibacteria bacterium]